MSPQPNKAELEEYKRQNSAQNSLSILVGILYIFEEYCPIRLTTLVSYSSSYFEFNLERLQCPEFILVVYVIILSYYLLK